MLTPFFNQAVTAMSVGAVLTIILSLRFLAIQHTENFPDSATWAVSLLSPSAFGFVMGKVIFKDCLRHSPCTIFESFPL